MVTVMRIGDLPEGKVRNDLQAALSPSYGESGTVGAEYGLDKVGAGWLANLALPDVPVYGPDQERRQRVVRSDLMEVQAAAMMTLLSDLPSRKDTGYNPFGNNDGYLIPFVQMPRSGSKWLDLRYVLDGKTAILIGLTDNPGPVRLKVEGQAVEPSSGRCVVRAILPLRQD